MKKSGFAFHCHHDVLFEYVYNYDKRVVFIKEHKPAEEQEIRLRLFKMIPEDRLPVALLKAWKAYDKVWKAYDCNKVWEAYIEVREAYNKAYSKASKAYYKAMKACEPELEKLHRELCPDCPWDGDTMLGGK